MYLRLPQNEPPPHLKSINASWLQLIAISELDFSGNVNVQVYYVQSVLKKGDIFSWQKMGHKSQVRK